jgi:hypothetical protein
MARDNVSGLVIGGETVEWAVVRPGQPAPESSGAEPLPPVAAAEQEQPPDGRREGADGAPAGVAQAAAEPAQATRQDTLRRVCGGLRGTVSLALPSDQLLLRVATLPAGNVDELAGMVQLQVDKWSPFPVDQMSVAYDVLATKDNGFLVLMAAAREETASASYREMEGAGVRPARMDARIMGRWRTLKDAGAIMEQGRQVIVLLGDGKPEMIVAQDGLPLGLRVLDVPDQAPPEELAEELLRESAHTLLSIELEHGVAPVAGVWVGAPGGPPAALGTAFQQEHPGAAVVLHDLSLLPPAVAGVALRLADQAEGGIDLVPAEFRRMGTARAFRRRLVAAVVAVVCFWAVAVAGLFGMMAYEQMALSGLKAERDRWIVPAKEVGATKRRVGVIRLYMDQRYSALECMREIGECKPDGVFLNAMNYKKAEAIRMNGEADSAESVYALKSSLAASPLFKNADATLLGPNHDPRKNKYSFELKLSLPDASGGAQ